MSISDRIRLASVRLAASLFGRRARDFARSERANVAMIFGLSLVPLSIAAGAGLDYSRALLVHAQLITALDAAGLAVGATQGLSQSQMQTMAQQYFDANYKLDSSYGSPTQVVVNETGQQVTVSCSDAMPTTLMNIVGVAQRERHFDGGVGSGKALGLSGARQHRLDEPNRQHRP
jgi:Flp pilus assembly protein TadG